jgi:hypothetical protein
LAASAVLDKDKVPERCKRVQREECVWRREAMCGWWVSGVD